MDENTPETQDDGYEFEAAFDEFATGETPELDTDPEPEELETEDPAEPEDSQAEEVVDEPGDAPDIWATASDEQRAAINELQRDRETWRHKYQSNDGRVSALQRKINELQDQLAQQTFRPISQESAPPPLSEELEAFKDDYPDIANAVDAYVKHSLAAERMVINEQLATLDNRFKASLQPIREIEHQRYIDSQMMALNERHPDWQNLVNTTEFADWFALQPEPVQQMISSEDASDASYLLDTFKRATNYSVQEEPSAPTATTSNQQKLVQAVTPKARRQAPRAGVPDDFEAAFAYYADN